MYSKYKLNASQDVEYYINNYYEKGLSISKSNHAFLDKNLNKYIDLSTGRLDGDKIEKEWFREIDVDIFISHSHKDEKLAISLVGWLKEVMGLNAFVDSTVWGFSDELLNIINNKYNILSNDSNGSVVYSHSKANYAASHVYLMLNSALNNMLDKTECLFFINTPNATIQMDKEKANDETLSPWIYSEVVMANTLRITKPERLNIIAHSQHSQPIMEFNQMEMTHILNFENFKNISLEIFSKWEQKRNNNEYALDTLYRITKGGVLND